MRIFRALRELLMTVLLVCLASCASGAPVGPLTFCIMGDVPYKPEEHAILAKQLRELPADCRFVMHVGDIQPGPKEIPVTEENYKKVAAILKQSPVPLFIVPGDNEFNDPVNHEEAWGFWNRHFLRFEEHWPNRPATARQAQRQENVAWVTEGVLFVGINLVGGRIHDRSEWRLRHAQDAAWVAEQFEGHKAEVSCAVLFAQANPTRNHADFMTALNAAATAFEKPVLFVHGDGHKWIMDRPFEAQNILRVQVDMGGIAPPLQVTIDPAKMPPFVLDRRLPAENVMGAP
jgi:hypothetical protein